MATTEEEEPWKQIPTRKRSDAAPPAPKVLETRNRNDSRSAHGGDAMIGTETLGGRDAANSQLGLLDTKILDITSGDEPTVTSLQDSPHSKHPRKTRCLYFYFMLGV